MMEGPWFPARAGVLERIAAREREEYTGRERHPEDERDVDEE